MHGVTPPGKREATAVRAGVILDRGKMSGLVIAKAVYKFFRGREQARAEITLNGLLQSAETPRPGGWPPKDPPPKVSSREISFWS